MSASNVTCCSIEKEIKNRFILKTKELIFKKKKKERERERDDLTRVTFMQKHSQSDFFQPRTHKYAYTHTPQLYVVFYAETQFIKNVHEETQ